MTHKKLTIRSNTQHLSGNLGSIFPFWNGSQARSPLGDSRKSGGK